MFWPQAPVPSSDALCYYSSKTIHDSAKHKTGIGTNRNLRLAGLSNLLVSSIFPLKMTQKDATLPPKRRYAIRFLQDIQELPELSLTIPSGLVAMLALALCAPDAHVKASAHQLGLVPPSQWIHDGQSGPGPHVIL